MYRKYLISSLEDGALGSNLLLPNSVWMQRKAQKTQWRDSNSETHFPCSAQPSKSPVALNSPTRARTSSNFASSSAWNFSAICIRASDSSCTVALPELMRTSTEFTLDSAIWYSSWETSCAAVNCSTDLCNLSTSCETWFFVDSTSLFARIASASAARSEEHTSELQ